MATFVTDSQVKSTQETIETIDKTHVTPSLITPSTKIDKPHEINIPARTNQDRGKYWNISLDEMNIILFCVADGHGKKGHIFAELIINHLNFIINSKKINWNEAIKFENN